MNINLHIERLVLEGLPFTRAQGPQVRDAVGAELARLLQDDGLVRERITRASTPRLRTADIRLAAHGSPSQLGGQIGRAVYGGIAK